MDLSANASLVRCRADAEPLLVVKQVSAKGRRREPRTGSLAWA
jgi:hypothetical protein